MTTYDVAYMAGTEGTTELHYAVEADVVDVHPHVLVFSKIDMNSGGLLQIENEEGGPTRIPATVTFILPMDRLVSVCLRKDIEIADLH